MCLLESQHLQCEPGDMAAKSHDTCFLTTEFDQYWEEIRPCFHDSCSGSRILRLIEGTVETAALHGVFIIATLILKLAADDFEGTFMAKRNYSTKIFAIYQ